LRLIGFSLAGLAGQLHVIHGSGHAPPRIPPGVADTPFTGRVVGSQANISATSYCRRLHISVGMRFAAHWRRIVVCRGGEDARMQRAPRH
jgi:hypothetical protein